MNHKFPEDLLTLIAYLKKLPGVGTRTAERFAFELLSWSPTALTDFSESLKTIQAKIPPCNECGCLTHLGNCRFCDLATRSSDSLCIIASPRDAYAVEETKTFRGLYHVVEHLLSPLDGRHAAAFRADRIIARISKLGIKEVIIAFDSTLEGDTTALYLKSQLGSLPLSISRLAFGLPVGSSIEYIDGGTLARAFVGRQTL
ncbi:MAG: recombination mediator RecR [Chlamydiota bacterium]